MRNSKLSEVAVEMNVIFDNMSDDLLTKIPNDIRMLFKEIASKEYNFNYDKSKKLVEQEVQKETKGILAAIYRDYICAEKEREEYIEKVNVFLQNREKEKREKYNPDNLFNKREEVIEESSKDEIIVVENKSLFKKIIEKIKKIIKR